MPKINLWWESFAGSVASERIRRRIYSPSGALMLMFLAIIVSLVHETFVVNLTRINVKYVIVLVGLLLIIIQAMFEYRRRTFDAALALKYREIFDQMKPARSKAAKALLNYKENSSYNVPSSVDEVLDFFEDIGFFRRGDQISSEVAHHYFYYWIKGYYQTSEKYIQRCRKAEPATWRYIEELFEATSQIESEKSGVRKNRLRLNIEEFNSFLHEEGKLS